MAEQLRSPPESRLGDEIYDASTPSPDLFFRAAALCRRDRAQWPAALERALESAAWVEAALTFLDHALPGTAHMAGRLPDGTAHVRLMLRRGSKASPSTPFGRTATSR